MNTIHSALQGLAMTSLLVSGVTIIFLALRPLLRRAIGSQWVCVLWLALLARLLMPWPVESRWSLFNDWRPHRDAPAVAETAPVVVVKVSVSPSETTKDNGAVSPAHPVEAQAAERRWDFTDARFWGAVWMAGAACGLAMLGWRWLQTRRLGLKTHAATDERLLRIFHSLPREARGRTTMRMTDAVATPTLAGIFRPQIWMPSDWPAQFSDEELRQVLLHELGHARRGDLIAQWLFAFAQCAHWFNPLVWMAARAARFDREMACDAWALARGGDHEAYGSALMKAVRLLRGPVPAMHGTAAMASTRRGLCARISGIGAFRPVPVWRGAAGVLLMLLALAVVTTNRTTAADGKEGDSKPDASAPAAVSDATKPEGSVQIEVQTKFVEITEEAWKKLSKADPQFAQFKFPELDHEKTAYADLKDKMQKGEDAAWEIPESDIGQLAILSNTELEKMIAVLDQKKEVNLLAAPAVTTKDGQKALVEAIVEFRYPSEFEEHKDPIPGTDPQGRKVMVKVPMTPSEFETRNLGVTLEVTPRFKDGEIAMDIKPTLAGFIGWESENKGVKTLDWELRDMTKIQHFPVFSTSTGKINATIHNGQTLLMGGVRVESAKDGSLKEMSSRIDGAYLPFHDQGPNAAPETARSVVLVFVSAKDVVVPPSKPDTGMRFRENFRFVKLDEAEWKKVCATIPYFKSIAPGIPGMDKEKKSYAEALGELPAGNEDLKTFDAPMDCLGVLPKIQADVVIPELEKETGKIDKIPALTHGGQAAVLKIGLRDVRYQIKAGQGDTPPEFATRNVGFEADVTPEPGNGADTKLLFTTQSTTFLGFVREQSGQKSLADESQAGMPGIGRPVFNTVRSVFQTTVQEPQTAVVGGMETEVVPSQEGGKPTTRRSVILLFVETTEDKPDDGPASSPLGSPQPVADYQIPSGVPVSGKPGFVTSPYAPDKGDIDVRGYGSGTEVKDPYSGKIFLVP
ncbi:MAG TPA: M56 family metallopeptidase [Chthoniobacteraceae bacterium]|nr:M56 family metallopeptidase [Chthoniobacteraceae bacterium]